MKRAIALTVFFLAVMTAVSANCFCAPETAASGVSFQRSHPCCDSNVISSCAAHIDKACQTERAKEFVVSSSHVQFNSEAVLTSSFISRLDFHPVETLPFTAFQKAQKSLFLKNEVLRI